MELTGPLPECFAPAVGAEHKLIGVPALDVVPRLRLGNEHRFPEIGFPEFPLSLQPLWVASALLVCGEHLLDAVEHVERTNGAPSYFARVTVQIQSIQPVLRREEVLAVFAEADSGVPPLAALVEARNLGSSTDKLGEHTTGGGNELVIAAFLESKLIPIKRMQVAGYGDTRPRFFPDTAYKRNLNRRVQILLLPEDKDR
mgnify:CR=1 FL=1